MQTNKKETPQRTFLRKQELIMSIKSLEIKRKPNKAVNKIF